MNEAEQFNLVSWFIHNWEVVFLYGLKYVNDTNKILAIHDTEIKNLNEKIN